VVVGDWLRPLTLFRDLHIFQHVNKCVKRLTTETKQHKTNPKQNKIVLLQHAAMLALQRCTSYSNSVCPSVCPPHAGIVSK